MTMCPTAKPSCDDARLRQTIPDPKPRGRGDPGVLRGRRADVGGQWLGPNVDLVADRLLVGVENADGQHVVEPQAYYESDGEQIDPTTDHVCRFPALDGRTATSRTGASAGVDQPALVVVGQREQRFAPSPLYDEPCMIASVLGSSSASRRIVGAVFGVRHVEPNMSSACAAASTTSLVVSAGPSPTCDRRSPQNSVPVVSS